MYAWRTTVARVGMAAACARAGRPRAQGPAPPPPVMRASAGAASTVCRLSARCAHGARRGASCSPVTDFSTFSDAKKAEWAAMCSATWCVSTPLWPKGWRRRRPARAPPLCPTQAVRMICERRARQDSELAMPSMRPRAGGAARGAPRCWRVWPGRGCVWRAVQTRAAKPPACGVRAAPEILAPFILYVAPRACCAVTSPRYACCCCACARSASRGPARVS